MLVETLAGTGRAGFSGDGGPSAAAQIAEPFGVVVGPDGALYFCDLANHRIRRLDLTSSTITTIAGTGARGYGGDGGAALEATLNEPYEIRFDAAGDLFFVDMLAHVVRRIDRASGVITTVAGTGEPGFSGDGGPAVTAMMDRPHSIEFDADGQLYVCDILNHRIRRVNLDTGVIETFAGTGEQAATPEGAARLGTALNGPRAIAFDGAGDMFLALREGNRVLRLAQASDTFHLVAGTGERGYRGDGGDAKVAELSGPKGIALSADGGVFIADTESHTVRRIDLGSGCIETVLGDGTAHDGPDGAPLSCGLARPHGVCIDAAGSVYVGDSENHRVRRLRR